MSDRAIHIFDVCGTLFLDDTTVGLISWHMKRRRKLLKQALVHLLFSRKSPLNLLVRVAERLTRRHLAKHLALSLLSGEAIADVALSAEDYVEYLLEYRGVEPILRELSQAQKGALVILASASIDPVIDALCKKLQVQGVSSCLATSSGCYTGKLERDLTGQKVQALLESMGPDVFARASFAYTDNLTDLDLLLRCHHRTVVLHKPAHRARWPIEQTQFVELY